MKLTVEISKYPLADDYIGPIKGFIDELNKSEQLKIITNTLSTQVFGDYDEVMEHQRQRFYGLRQGILEGRQVKSLVFEYIEDVVDDAINEYLD
ncbi:MAG: hypothetical protein COB75_02430, partial [Idiomarina sp.]